MSPARDLTEAELQAEMQRLLERRADRLRDRPHPLEGESALFVAEFPLGDRRIAIPLEQLRAAVPLRAVTPVPLAAPHVLGILRFQGQLVAALSLHSLLGGAGWKDDPAVLLIVDAGEGRLCALDCEQIPKPAGIPRALAEQAAGQAQGPLAAVTLPDGRELSLLDVRRLLERAPREVRRGA
jgi:purine-binding chemotaxis protein CheW